jgi:hypothetical protein
MISRAPRKPFHLPSDGIIPNSVLSNKIRTVVGFIEIARGHPPLPNIPQKPKTPQDHLHAKTPPKEAGKPKELQESFTAKLKRMIEQNNAKAGIKEKEPTPEESPQEESSKHERRLAHPVYHPPVAEVMEEEKTQKVSEVIEATKTTEEAKYPKIIDTGLQYLWFPIDKVFIYLNVGKHFEF